MKKKTKRLISILVIIFTAIALSTLTFDSTDLITDPFERISLDKVKPITELPEDFKPEGDLAIYCRDYVASHMKYSPIESMDAMDANIFLKNGKGNSMHYACILASLYNKAKKSGDSMIADIGTYKIFGIKIFEYTMNCLYDGEIYSYNHRDALCKDLFGFEWTFKVRLYLSQDRESDDIQRQIHRRTIFNF